MTDIAAVGVAYDSGPLKQLVSDLDAADAAQKRVVASADDLARAQAQVDQINRSAAESISRRSPGLGSASDIEATIKGPAAAVLKKMTEDAEAAKLAQKGLNEELPKTGGFLSSLGGMLGGYGSAHASSAEKVVHHAAAHSELSKATHEVQHAIHALHPVLATAGTGMGELSGFAGAARGGFVALAAAITGTFLVELAKTSSEMEKLKREFSDVFGDAGPAMFAETKKAAEELNTQVDKLAPSVEAVFRNSQRDRYGRQIDEKEALAQSGVTFAPGAAGQAAMEQIAGLNATSLLGPDSKVGKDLQNLSHVFEIAGESAATAAGKANSFFRSFPKSAEEASQGALKASADITKMFEVSGKSADESVKGTQQFFEGLKKGLSADSFEKLASESKAAAQAVAEGFGFTGKDAIDKFAAALDKVGSVSFDDVLVAIGKMHDKIEEAKVPDSVTKSWDALKAEFKNSFEVMAEEAFPHKEGKPAAAEAFDEITASLKSLEPTFASFAKGTLAQFKQEWNDLKAILKGIEDSFTWLSDHTPDFVKNAFKGIANGPDGPQPESAPKESDLPGGSVWSRVGGGSDMLKAIMNGPNGPEGQKLSSDGGPPAAATMGLGLGETPDFTKQASPIPSNTPPVLSVYSTPSSVVSPSDDRGNQKPADQGQQDQSQQPLQPSASAASTLGLGLGETPDFTATSDAAAKATDQVSNLNSQVQQQADTASSASSSVDQLSASISSMASAADSASQSGGGGGSGGPQLDTADIGGNASGGVYMIGGAGADPSPSATGGTDSINLKGTVSPGEMVAVIPADKANQASLDALKGMINTDPVSIGGGGVSGTGTTESQIVSSLAGSQGPLPAGLDPTVRGLLQQIYLRTISGYHLPQPGAPFNPLFGPNATTPGGGGVRGGGGGKSSEDDKKKEDQAQQQSRQFGPPTTGTVFPGRGTQVQGGTPGAGPNSFAPDPNYPTSYDYQEYTGAGNFTGENGQDQYDPNFSSYDLPSSDPFFDPYSANAGGGIGADSGSDFSYTGDYNLYSGDVSGGDASGGDAPSADIGSNATGGVYSVTGAGKLSNMATSSIIMPDGLSNVNVGHNADGGVYTIGGPGEVTAGDSGKVDALNLVGKVSPGELVAVIPKQKATAVAAQSLSSLVSGSGGGPQGLSLSANQLTNLLQQITRLQQIATYGAGTPYGGPLSGVSGGVQGGGGGKSNQDNKNNGAQDQSRAASAPSGGRSSRSQGAARPGAGPNSMAQEPTPGNYSYNSPFDPSSTFTGYQLQGDSLMNSYNLPYDSQYYDPYSAYAGGGVGYGGNSYDLPYDSQFYDPFSAGGTQNDWQSQTSGYASDFNSSDFNYLDNSGGGGGGVDTSSGVDTSGGSAGEFDSSGLPYTSDQTVSNDAASYSSDNSSASSSDFSSSDAGDFASGGSFRVPMPPGGGTDTVPTRMNLTGGELVSIFPEDAQTPGGGATTPTAYAPAAASVGGGGQTSSTQSGNNVSVNVFGVNSPAQFMQSRLAISRGMRYV